MSSPVFGICATSGGRYPQEGKPIGPAWEKLSDGEWHVRDDLVTAMNPWIVEVTARNRLRQARPHGFLEVRYLRDPPRHHRVPIYRKVQAND